MKKLLIKLSVLLFVCLLGSCSVFKGGCKCPPVRYNTYPGR